MSDLTASVERVLALPAPELSAPTESLAHYARGRLHERQGNRAEAERDYRTSLELDPEGRWAELRARP